MNKAKIKDAIYWLNAFPSDNGESNTLTLAETLQGLSNPNYDKATIDFGSDAQLHTVTQRII